MKNKLIASLLAVACSLIASCAPGSQGPTKHKMNRSSYSSKGGMVETVVVEQAPPQVVERQVVVEKVVEVERAPRSPLFAAFINIHVGGAPRGADVRRPYSGMVPMEVGCANRVPYEQGPYYQPRSNRRQVMPSRQQCPPPQGYRPPPRQKCPPQQGRYQGGYSQGYPQQSGRRRPTGPINGYAPYSGGGMLPPGSRLAGNAEYTIPRQGSSAVYIEPVRRP